MSIMDTKMTVSYTVLCFNSNNDNDTPALVIGPTSIHGSKTVKDAAISLSKLFEVVKIVKTETTTVEIIGEQ